MDPTELQTINHRYHIVRPLGEGGMGRVYLVEDSLQDGATFALKLITSDGATPSQTHLFKREFASLRQFSHPHIARVYDFGFLQQPRGFYFTSEYVEGDEYFPRLEDWGEEVFLATIVQILQALDYIHRRAFVHNDIKPTNLIVDPEKNPPHVKLIDFGLARRQSLESGAEVSGTVFYLAPERIRRGVSTPATDLYALGVTLYYVLTGSLPFTGDSSFEVFEAHLKHHPDGVRTLNPAVSTDLEELVSRLMAKDPADRLGSAGEVIEWINGRWNWEYPIQPHRVDKSHLSVGKLVAREKEMEVLEELVKKVQLGEGPGTVIIEGVSGMGKTRLIEEVRYLCQMAGVLCGGATGRRYQAEVQVFRRWVVEVATYLSWDHHLVKKYEKYLTWAHPKSKEHLDAYEGDRKQIWYGVVEFLVAVADTVPLVLTLDDGHLLSPSGREAVESLSIRTAAETPGRLALVFTRNREGASPSLSRQGEAFRKWSEEEGVQLLSLSPFTSDQLLLWWDTRFPREEITPPFLGELWDKTGGNPWFVEELVQYTFDCHSGSLSEDREDWPAIGVDDLPAILARRIEDLPRRGSSRSLLHLLALSLEPLTRDALTSMVEEVKEEEDRAEPLDLLLDRHLVKVERSLSEEGEDLYSIGHERLAQVVRDTFSQEGAKDLHLALAKWGEGRWDESLLAHHYLAGEDRTKARKYVLRSLPRLLDTGDLTTALHLVKEAGELSPRAKTIQLALAQVYLALEQPDQARPILEGLAEKGGGVKFSVQVHRARFEMARQEGQTIEAREALTRALELASPHSDLAGEVEWEWGRYWESIRRWSEGRDHYERAVSQLSLERDLYALALHQVGEMRLQQGDLSGAKEEWRRLVDHSGDRGDIRHLSLALHSLSLAYQIEEDLEEAYEFFRQSLEIIDQFESSREIGLFYLNLAERRLEVDREGARKILERGLKIFRSLGDPMSLGRTHFLLGRYFELSGQGDPAFYQFLEGESIFARRGADLERGRCLEKIGDYYFGQGDWSSAIYHYQTAYTRYQAAGGEEFLQSLSVSLAWLEMRRDRGEAARRYLNHYLEGLREKSESSSLWMSRVLGLLIEVVDEGRLGISSLLDELDRKEPDLLSPPHLALVKEKILPLATPGEVDRFIGWEEQREDSPSEVNGDWDELYEVARRWCSLRDEWGRDVLDPDDLEKLLAEGKEGEEVVAAGVLLGDFHRHQGKFQKALNLYLWCKEHILSEVESKGEEEQRIYLDKVNIAPLVAAIQDCHQRMPRRG